MIASFEKCRKRVCCVQWAQMWTKKMHSSLLWIYPKGKKSVDHLDYQRNCKVHAVSGSQLTIADKYSMGVVWSYLCDIVLLRITAGSAVSPRPQIRSPTSWAARLPNHHVTACHCLAEAYGEVPAGIFNIIKWFIRKKEKWFWAENYCQNLLVVWHGGSESHSVRLDHPNLK